tara:strand:+ start:109 stop:591 length:483 start_codon:yes stop_codon:yes gene_type:complete
MNNQFYNIIDTTKNFLLTGPFTNTVTFGDITDVDLDKETIFPLAHITVDNVQFNGPVAAFELKIMVMDIVDVNKNEREDVFIGNDNTQDILNSQMAVLQRFYTEVTRGSLSQAPFQLEDDILTAEPFKDRFKNTLAGWTCTLSLIIPEGSSTTNGGNGEC